MGATQADTIRCRASGHMSRRNGGRSPFGTPTSGSRRSRLAIFHVYVVTIVASAFPSTAGAQSDWTIPLLRGLHAVTVAVNFYIDGNAWDHSSPCHLEQAALERGGAKILQGAGLEAIGALDKLARQRALISELNEALRESEKAPIKAKPPDFREQSERRRREMEFLGSQPFLSVNIGVAPVDGGLCAAGITTQFRAFARDGDTAVINYNGESVRAPLALWTAAPLALAAPTAEFEHALTERLDIQIEQFIAAWRTANGK
jgi:hypothetical protein